MSMLDTPDLPDLPDLNVYRILDANLDRTREALRVIEEWCRFARHNQPEVEIIKNLRQSLASWHHPRLRQARNTPADVGTALTHEQEATRSDIHSVMVANFCRAQEGLRVLAEYSKLYDAQMAQAMKQMRYTVYSLESTILHQGRPLRQQLFQAQLYLVTMDVPNFFAQIESALKGGVDMVQYRDKNRTDRDRLTIAHQLKELCAKYNALFLINDRIDLALAVGADGVHLGQQDLPVQFARQILGPAVIIGQSTTSPQELELALQAGVDYVGVGPVFATPTKPNKSAVGFDYIKHAQQKCPVPFFAIGGIDIDNLDPTIEAGASRVAVVRSLMTSNDPTTVARAMKQKLRSTTSALSTVAPTPP
jgi:thiamine-phosphate pyrophosphorylase